MWSGKFFTGSVQKNNDNVQERDINVTTKIKVVRPKRYKDHIFRPENASKPTKCSWGLRPRDLRNLFIIVWSSIANPFGIEHRGILCLLAYERRHFLKSSNILEKFWTYVIFLLFLRLATSTSRRTLVYFCSLLNTHKYWLGLDISQSMSNVTCAVFSVMDDAGGEDGILSYFVLSLPDRRFNLRHGLEKRHHRVHCTGCCLQRRFPLILDQITDANIVNIVNMDVNSLYSHSVAGNVTRHPAHTVTR